MKLKHLIITILLLLLAGTLSACGASGASAASSWPGLSAQDGVAFLANNQHIYAVDIATGSEKWRFPAEAERNSSFYAKPFPNQNGQVIVGGFNNILYSLSAQTGAQTWSFAEADNRYIGGSIQVEDTIYAPNADGHVYALDAATGSLVWKFPEQGAVGPLWATPLYNPDCACLYATSMDHQVYAIDGGSGELIWSSDNLGGSVVGTPALDPDGTLYVGTFGRELVAIESATGNVRWRVPVTGWVWGGPILVDERLYFGDLDGNFYSVSIADQSINFQIQPDAAISESPLNVEGLIFFVTESGTMYAVDADGAIQRTQTLGGKLYTSPVVNNDTLLVATLGGDELLAAFNAAGAGKWNFIPE